MRRTLDPALLREALRELGRLARGPGRVYLTGGACALLKYPSLDEDGFRARVTRFVGAQRP
jgi:hypothetical protein